MALNVTIENINEKLNIFETISKIMGKLFTEVSNWIRAFFIAEINEKLRYKIDLIHFLLTFVDDERIFYRNFLNFHFYRKFSRLIFFQNVKNIFQITFFSKWMMWYKTRPSHWNNDLLHFFDFFDAFLAFLTLSFLFLPSFLKYYEKIEKVEKRFTEFSRRNFSEPFFNSI